MLEAIGPMHSWQFKSTPYTQEDADRLNGLIADFTAKSGIKFTPMAQVVAKNSDDFPSGCLGFFGYAILRISGPSAFNQADKEMCSQFERHLSDAGLHPTRTT